MWAQFANRDSLHSPQNQYAQSTILNVCTFLLPLSLLLIFDFLDHKHSFFDIRFFLLGTAIESSISLALAFLFQKDHISKKKYFQIDFLNRTVIGLPFTIYLAIAHPVQLLFLTRLVPGIIFIISMRNISLLIVYNILFSGGCLVYIFFKNYGLPSATEWLLLIFLFVFNLANISIAGLYWNRLLDQLKSMKKSLSRKRQLNKLEIRLVQFANYSLPKKESQSWFESPTLKPREGHALIVCFMIKDLRKYLEKNNTTDTRHGTILAESLQHDLNLFRQSIQNEFKDSEFYKGEFDGQTLTMANFLSESKKEPRLYVKTVLALQRILQIQQRSRTAVLQRGLRYWQLAITVEIGNIQMFYNNALSPGIVFTDPALQAIIKENRNASELATGPMLSKFLEDYFPDIKAGLNDWQSPGLLAKNLDPDDFSFSD